MSSDDVSLYRQGEMALVFANFISASGSACFSSAPKCTLWDSSPGGGSAVTGFSTVDVTGYTPGTAGTVQAWYNLDTSGLVDGRYRMVFRGSVTGSDNITRLLEPCREVHVLGVNKMETD